jgi:hypothetical protein
VEKFNIELENNKGNLYKNRDPRNTIVDGEPKAFYWYKYRKTYEVLMSHLKIGEKIDLQVGIFDGIPEDILLERFQFSPNENLYDIPIVIIGNGNLHPHNFDIRKKDREDIDGELCFPGKSATIGFSENLAETCGGIFDRDCRKQDKLYVSTVREIEDCNYSVYYLPTVNQPLHVRMVHRVHELNPDEHFPPFNDKKKLTDLFISGKSS